MCFSIFCQVNSHHGDEWRGEKRDTNNNPGMAANRRTEVPQIPEVPEQAAIGNLHLSFEFHQNILKVRVWQISDLLLPPPQTSMIDSIFVRSYLIPDNARKTTRKTENIQVEGSSRDRRVKGQAPVGGVQHIFTPSSFRFDTPLVYTGVTPDIVKQRSIRLEVCMTQKRSGKPFLMAMVHMPLQTAVRKPIRERYPLIPCMNYTIPNTMRVYNAKDIIIETSSSNSTLHRLNSSVSQSEKSVNVSRDNESIDVDVDSLIRNFTGTSDSSSDDNEDDDDGIGSSFEMKTTVGKSLGSSVVTVDMTSTHTDDEDSVGDLREILSHQTSAKKADTAIDINTGPQKSAKKKIIPNELLEVVSDNFREDPKEESCVATTVVVLEEELQHTVVDMQNVEDTQDISPRLSDNSGNVVIEMETDFQNGDNRSTNKTIGEKPARKKKIIPIELNLDDIEPLDSIDATSVDMEKSIPESMVRSIPESMVDSGCVFDDTGSVHDETDSEKVINSKDNTSPTVVVSPPSNSHPGKKAGPRNKRLLKVSNTEDDEISCELRQAGKLSVSDSLCEVEASQTPGSRPETPIWDYFDFVEEEAGVKEVKAAKDPSTSVGGSAPKVEGTLAESIARLGRTMTTLDTEVVSGPVLPPVVLEDFDMEEES